VVAAARALPSEDEARVVENEDRPGATVEKAEVPIAWDLAVARVRANRPGITNADEALLDACLPPDPGNPAAQACVRAF
jgi:hypothetical protein